jgi:hypothetical protein
VVAHRREVERAQDRVVVAITALSLTVCAVISIITSALSCMYSTCWRISWWKKK